MRSGTCSSTTTGFEFTRPTPAAGPRRSGRGCTSNGRRERLLECIIRSQAGIPAPASLYRTKGKCCGGTTDGDGNQTGLLRLHRQPILAFPRQYAETKLLTRWLPWNDSVCGGDLRLRESLSFFILGVSRLHHS